MTVVLIITTFLKNSNLNEVTLKQMHVSLCKNNNKSSLDNYIILTKS